ncbi:MAG: hypothetical protein EOL89_02315 [Actinobacteria bacterium]|nr:hypothetical protein [Actinomycetota bacterium]
MITSAQVDLRGEPDWDPARLILTRLSYPGRPALVSLAEVSEMIPPATMIDYGVPVITPASIDPVRGGVRRRSRRFAGRSYHVGAGKDALQVGDLLVPNSPDIPAVYVSDDLKGSTVASTFTAMRPTGGASLWLWAVLNSESGIAVRRLVADTAFAKSSSRGSIASILVPEPPNLVQSGRLAALASVEETTRGNEVEPIGTWWSFVNLTGASWAERLATGVIPQDVNSVPLNSLCAIERGRSATEESTGDPNNEGTLPLIEIGVLSGRAPSRRIALGRQNVTLAEPGDVVLAAIGDWAYATVLEEPAVIHRNVYRLRFHDPAIGPAVARYLNRQEGFRTRQAFLSGVTIKSLTKGNLTRFPIPSDVLVPQPTQVSDGRPLSVRLEETLWKQ